MRYSVFFKKEGGKKTCVYNTMSPDLTLALMNPKVHLAADSAGTFECSLNPNSPGIPDTVLERMATKVLVEEHKDENSLDNKIIFYGRVLSIDEDFYNTPSLYCEGAFSFFNDTVIMPGKNLSKKNATTYNRPIDALISILEEHNAAVSMGYQQTNGILFSARESDMKVTMPSDLFSKKRQDGSDKAIDDFVIDTYTNTLEVLNSLKKNFGGHFRIRYRYVEPTGDDDAEMRAMGQMAVPILDWIDDMYKDDATTEQDLTPKSYIRFGENMLDFTKKRDGTNIVNCLFLTGKKIGSKDNVVISDEIDIAPMCYQWKLDKDGNPIDPKHRPSTYSTWDDTKYPIHDPESTSDLFSGGVPKDINVSHVYHIGEGWYAWNPQQNDYINLASPVREATDEEFANGDVIRMQEEVPTGWTVDSRGMATGFKSMLVKVGGDDQVMFLSQTQAAGHPEYPLADTTYIATGFWNSIDSGSVQPDHGTLSVYPGEKYYLCSSGYSGVTTSAQRLLSTVMYIITTGELRTSNATIISSSTATEQGTINNFKEVNVPEINSQTDSTNQMILNICARRLVEKESDFGAFPDTRRQLNAHLYRTRTLPYDTYVTLWGIADGEHRLFLSTEEEINAQTGKKSNKTVLRTADPVKENRMGVNPTILPAEEGHENDPVEAGKWFMYPKAGDGEEVLYFRNYAAIEAQTGATGKYYVDLETANVYTWNATTSKFNERIDRRAYKVDSYLVTDDPATKKYGRIEKIVNFASCEDPEALKELGAKALFEAKLEAFEVNVTALDLSLLETNVDSPDILDPIKIYSDPHKVDIILPLSERDIPLNDPASQQYSIGYQGTQKISKTYSWIRK